jgi:acrylyl-CoA reductase (NADPH)
MTDRFRAFRIHSEGGRIVARFEEISLADLSPGEVVIRVTHSGINYKDALAATGAGKILRRYPLVGGVDLAGVVESSADPRYHAGEGVLVTGCALSETHDGGYAQFARVHGDWVIPLPAGMSAFEAMALGTAGFTAALAIHRMEHNGQHPQGGPILVTGASGGVGSIAVDMLATRGYRVIAVRCSGGSSWISAAARSRPRATAAPSTTWAASSSPGSHARWISGATSRASDSPRDRS